MIVTLNVRAISNVELTIVKMIFHLEAGLDRQIAALVVSIIVLDGVFF